MIRIEGSRRTLPLLPLLLFLLAIAAGCVAPGPTLSPAPGAVFFTGAGDIGDCGGEGVAATARLLDDISGHVWTTGDNAYPAGSLDDFARCYHPYWGRHKERTRPTPGNHEYWTPGALPYFEYFGEAAGEAGKGWYTYEYGGWRVIALNSNIETGPDSPQLRWLRALLAGDSSRCTIAYFHHPLVSSGAHAGGPDVLEADVRAFWAALYEGGVDVALTGHDHHYERFAPLTPLGTVDEQGGVRQFIVGTGGGQLRRGRQIVHPASEALVFDRFGVLKLELREAGYGWEFIATDGRVLDSGDGRCH